VSETAYDVMGRGYERVRRPDPRFEQAISEALGDATTVVNVGAGTGSYEPRDRWVLAVEPSEVMIAQRPAGTAPVIRAQAEHLPLANATVDAGLAVLTIHHWADPEAGLRELLRVVRTRIVIVTVDVDRLAELWVVRDYFPELMGVHAERFPSIERLLQLLPDADARALPVPQDCQDRFLVALWARPEAYFDPVVRAATSPWYDLPDDVVEEGLARLRRDVESGEWHRRYAELLARDELDVGLRLITSQKASHAR